MSITPAFLDQIRARIAVSTVVGARVKLTRKGNKFWGCCPFHNEKTPSFTVSDDKEFYYCFGCSEHGDIINFVMKTQGITFVEAVSQLSAQAGLQMPSISPEQQKKEQHRVSLYEICEIACVFFQKNLYSNVGQSVLSYVKSRGLGNTDIQNFRLGYSPDSNSFVEYMQSKNIDIQALVDTGLARQNTEGVYAFFRHRLMFPITDTRGRVVAFGGRFIGDEKQAKVGKYINSPQGILYDKSRVLYNLKNARESAYKQNRLVVCEGYMDVIALHRAGFEYTIAPCGTAMTEDQLLQCWKTVDEPILCFDGDEAGKKAALRTCERALPLLVAGKSVNIAMMPSGQDPDDIMRTQGKDTMTQILDTAIPLRDFLWKYAVQSFNTDTPERLAKMEQQLYIWASSIRDTFLAKNYRRNFNKLVWNTFKFNRKTPMVQSTTPQLHSMNLSEQQQKVLLACFINHPKVLDIYVEKCMELFVDAYKNAFETAYNGVLDGVETADKMYQYLQENGHRQMVDAVCTRHVYMFAKSACPPEAQDKDTEKLIKDILGLQEDNKVQQHYINKAKEDVSNDQIDNADRRGVEYRLQQQQLYDFDNWD